LTTKQHQPTWSDPIGDNAWNDLHWPGINGLKESLVSLVAFDERQIPHCIGTAFLVSSRGRSAACVTAAHNLYAGVSRVQYPARHHPSTPLEFIPNFERVDLDPTRFWALYQKGERPEACAVKSVVWDKRADVAVLTIEYREPSDADFVQGEWSMDGGAPTEGQLVGVAGWGSMTGRLVDADGVRSAGEIERRLILRVGRVTAVQSDAPMISGHSVETTIPVFGGMSGGPAFIWREWNERPTAFGFVSSDPEEFSVDVKNDFAIPGRSTIGVLPVQDINTSIPEDKTKSFASSWTVSSNSSWAIVELCKINPAPPTNLGALYQT
jgi:hypothetical protein